MKLRVSRGQRQTGSRLSFRLSLLLEVSSEEEAIIDQHGPLADMVLGWTRDVWDGAQPHELIDGVNFETGSVADAIEVERRVVGDCERLSRDLVQLPALTSTFSEEREYRFPVWKVEHTSEGVEVVRVEPPDA